RRHRARRGPADRRPDQHLVRGAGRVSRLPGRAGDPATGPDLAEGSIMSVATETTTRSAGKIRVTRSRRNMAWTGGGALVVVAALPLWWLVSRLRTGYFAIATWVLAATVMLIIERFSVLGGGTGLPMPGLTGIDPTLLAAYTYWIGLAVTVLALATVWLMLRG